MSSGAACLCAYPLWQRLYLLGSFSRRLEAIASGELERGFPTVLREFSAAVSSGSLRGSIETIPADPALQLEMVLQLVMLRVTGVSIPARLAESLSEFARGVGDGREGSIEGQSAAYAVAHDRYYAPFFARHPHILENLLVHMIFRSLFPLGKKLFDAEARPEPAREFALLATEFALFKGLLIGVAGAHKDAFSFQHVLRTVQAACKHFEHDPEFLSRTYGLLVERRLDDARGVTMLLRN